MQFYNDFNENFTMTMTSVNAGLELTQFIYTFPHFHDI